MKKKRATFEKTQNINFMCMICNKNCSIKAITLIPSVAAVKFFVTSFLGGLGIRDPPFKILGRGQHTQLNFYSPMSTTMITLHRPL